MKLKHYFLLFILVVPVLSFAALTQNSNNNSAINLTNIQTQQINKKEPYFIKSTYPQIKGDNLTQTRQRFNTLVKQLVKKTEAGFIKNVRGGMSYVHGKAIPGLPLTPKSNSLIISNDVMNTQKGIISIRFEIFTFFYGAAHPNSIYQTLNYDLKTGETLTLKDLFKAKSNYLSTIANYCQQSLLNQLVKNPDQRNEKNFQYQMIMQGAKATDKNYELWNITPKGLLINFNTYQVGAYYMGPQKVLIPYKDLQGILKQPEKFNL